MHLVHLAIGPDCITSALFDWSDTAKYIQGSSRDKRLEGLFESYRTWCEQQNVTDRASRKLFTVQILKPEGWKFVEPSQKILNATSCRYMLFWFCGIAKLFAEMHGSNEDMRHACINHVFLFSVWFMQPSQGKQLCKGNVTIAVFSGYLRCPKMLKSFGMTLVILG